MEQVCTRDPIPPSQYLPELPRDLEIICLKCLQKEPKDRYESAEALAEDLDRFLQNEPIKARSLSLVNRLARMLEKSHVSTELREWSNVLFFFAGVVLVIQGIFCWQLQTGQPMWGLLVTRAAQVILMVAGMAWFHPKGFSPRTPAERQLWSIWVGFILACVFSGFANRIILGPERSLRSALYPVWTAFSGMGFFALGSRYWGGCYVIGFAFFLLAMTMPWHVAWSPFTFGLLWALVLVTLAIHLRRLKPEE